MNFYQITSIIKIMAENLNIFTDNIHMTANMDSKLKKLRPYFIENLVFLTHYLLNPDTYKELKEQQEMALKNEIENNDNNNNKKKKAKEREYKGQLITFDDIKSSIIFI
jgi:amino acid permease